MLFICNTSPGLGQSQANSKLCVGVGKGEVHAVNGVGLLADAAESLCPRKPKGPEISRQYQALILARVDNDGKGSGTAGEQANLRCDFL